MKSLHDRYNEIRVLMDYALPADEQEEAYELLEQYQADLFALNIFKNFYSYLPEGMDDGIIKLRLLERKHGLCLFCVETLADCYWYLASGTDTSFLGNLDEGIWEDKILQFFNYQDGAEFKEKNKDVTQIPEYDPADNKDTCQVCAVVSGEKHILGCPMEICPWCNGQLTSCDCRFSELDQEELNESNLEELEEKLKDKGRVPFDPAHQKIAYPAD
jgi:hypothetical protein